MNMMIRVSSISSTVMFSSTDWRVVTYKDCAGVKHDLGFSWCDSKNRWIDSQDSFDTGASPWEYPAPWTHVTWVLFCDQDNLTHVMKTTYFSWIEYLNCVIMMIFTNVKRKLSQVLEIRIKGWFDFLSPSLSYSINLILKIITVLGRS